MKRFTSFIVLGLLLSLWVSLELSYGQEVKKSINYPKWRAGLTVQYTTSFKNLRVEYPGLNYTGVLGGFTGRGAELFVGYKPHKYLAVDVSFGLLLNQYNRTYNNGIFITGRFNKLYVQPGVKFIYPLLDRGWGTLNAFVGGGVGLHTSGRLYLETQAGGFQEIFYLRFNPMIAPFLSLGTELYFSDRSNLVIGIKYQNGNFEAKELFDSNGILTLRNVSNDVKNISGQGIGLMLGIIQEF